MLAASRNSKSLLLVLTSLFLVVVWLIFATGIDYVSFDRTDSKGRAMGFNDPLSFEHYRIILRSWNLSNLNELGYYDWLLVGMNLVGLLILLTGAVRMRAIRYFFVGQAALFVGPGILSFLVFPIIVFLVVTGTMDRESFTDWPFVSFPVHCVWIGASVLTFFALGKRLSGSESRVARQAV